MASLLDLLPPVFGLLLMLTLLSFNLFSDQPVPVFLLYAVLLKLGVLGPYSMVVFMGPGLLQLLRGFFDCQGNIPDVGVDHGL